MKRKSAIIGVAFLIIAMAMIVMWLLSSSMREVAALRSQFRDNLYAGDFRANVLVSSQIIAIQPNEAENYLLRANAFIGVQQYEDAIYDIGTALLRNNSILGESTALLMTIHGDIGIEAYQSIIDSLDMERRYVVPPNIIISATPEPNP